ncbi:MAG: amidohydrolase family protein [Candidatus Zixiibacteriota bacterium]
MRKVLFMFCTVALTLLICSTAVSSTGTTPELGIRDKTPDARAFINARLHISPDIVYDNAVFIIENGKVVKVGKDVSIPDGVTVIDLQGKTIYPGFIEPLSSYGIVAHDTKGNDRSRNARYTTDRIGGNAWNEAIHAEMNWFRFFKPDTEAMKKLHQSGFSIARSARQDGIFRGRSCVALIGEGLPNDVILDPSNAHIISFDRGTSKQEYPSSLMGTIAMIRQMFYDVQWYTQTHEAYKHNPGAELPEFNAAVEALANIESEPIVFDAGRDGSNLLRVKILCSEFDLSPVIVASGYEYNNMKDITGLNASLIVPVDFPETPEIKTLEDQLDVTLGQLRHWESAPGNPAALEKSGVPFAFTSYRLKKTEDFLPNVRKAVKRGLSEKFALAALTTVPAKLCGISNTAGTLEPGKLANFIVCDGNIFDDDCTIYSVWAVGKPDELIPLPMTEFSGQYELAIGDKKAQLTITGTDPKYKGEWTIDGWTGKLDDVSIDRTMIQFAGSLDSAKTQGIARFSGRKDGNTITGMCTLGDGTVVNWTAVRTGDAPADKKTDNAEKQDELLARTTYPNKAYGPEKPPQQSDILIKHATIWTADEAGILEDADMLIRDGRIEKIGKNLTAPSGIAVIDASGRHVTPGIIDAHSHIAIDGDVNEGTHAITPEVRIGDVIDPEQVNIYRQLAGGVTACLTLHGSANPIGGQCQAIKLRWGSDAEEFKIDGATPTIKLALGENVKQSNWGERFTTRYPQSRMGVEAIIRDVLQAAREYEQEWDAYNALSKKKQAAVIPPRRDLGLDAVVEFLHDEMLVHCHTYMQAETLMLMRLAEEYGFTIDVFIHVLEGYKVADEMAKHGVAGTTFSDWWAYKFEVYDAIPYNASLMAERGVLTSVKSDDIDLARRLNQEAGKVIHYGGMTPEEAIKLVTINSAKQIGIDDMTGSLTEGKDADFVIWSDYPLSMYAKAEQTWIDGAKYFDLETDKQLREDIEREKNALIQKVLSIEEKGGAK